MRVVDARSGLSANAPTRSIRALRTAHGDRRAIQEVTTETEAEPAEYAWANSSSCESARLIHACFEQSRKCRRVTPTEFLKKVRELPENSTRLYYRGVLRSRAVRTVLSDPGPPSVLTVEASDDAHLSFINT